MRGLRRLLSSSREVRPPSSQVSAYFSTWGTSRSLPHVVGSSRRLNRFAWLEEGGEEHSHPQSFPSALGTISHGCVVDQVAGQQWHAAQHLCAGEAHSVVYHPMIKVQASYHAAINAANAHDSCLAKETRPQAWFGVPPQHWCECSPEGDELSSAFTSAVRHNGDTSFDNIVWTAAIMSPAKQL